MIKIGKLNRFFLLLIATFSCFFTGYAQDVQVNATLSETNIFSGEQVKLELNISGTSMGSVQQPELPELEGLRWLSGSTSRGTKYALINGKPSVTYTFGYLLIAQSPGNYTIPSIEISVEGETYFTDPINFKVLDPSTIDSGESARAPDIYVRLEPNTTSPVVGEQVIADVILYFKSGVEVSSYQPTPGWKAEGFWKEELEYPQRAQTTSTIVNGIRYQKARLIQYALFPTKSGELTLSPFEISVSVRSRRSSSDPFGFGLNQERMNLQSVPVTLNVESLPNLQNADFIGAVGDFEISRTISNQNALVGESIEIITQVKGTGNVPLVNKPEYKLPASLEKYNPQESSSIERNNRQISGSRTFTDIVIARNEGTYTIPEKRIAYFNPTRNQYIIETLPELSFDVERDPDATLIAQNDLRFDVKPITGLAQWTAAETTPLYQRTSVWIMILFPVLLTGGVFGYKKYNDRMQTDTAFARSRTASQKVNKTITEAENTSDIKQGYYLIEKALFQFITDKLNLPPAGLSHRDIIQEIEQVADNETTAELKQLLTKCETIAYAPNVTQERLDSDILKTKALIKKIGKLS
ncbi:MAG: protein BatD [Gracilimonas sp.]|uniref:BatD family protein n=1 Tax=Gracilimonas sp. TaxID=1974203 RepID=UPI0019CD3A62|nr:BatD family protein [Gracilimonas sp.]MBD3617489.1 protein BatD [Gracilimonas sp.]